MCCVRGLLIVAAPSRSNAPSRSRLHLDVRRLPQAAANRSGLLSFPPSPLCQKWHTSTARLFTCGRLPPVGGRSTTTSTALVHLIRKSACARTPKTRRSLERFSVASAGARYGFLHTFLAVEEKPPLVRPLGAFFMLTQGLGIDQHSPPQTNLRIERIREIARRPPQCSKPVPLAVQG